VVENNVLSISTPTITAAIDPKDIIDALNSFKSEMQIQSGAQARVSDQVEQEKREAPTGDRAPPQDDGSNRGRDIQESKRAH